MLALRLTRVARPYVQLRRLLVAAASGATGFLLLSALGYAMAHPDDPGASVLRLLWCAAPLAATVHFAVAAARTDPATKPRPALSAIGLGPARLMAVSAVTTALATALGSMLALLVFLHLRGDLTGMPFDGAAREFLAADQPLPLPAALTLLALVPAAASLSTALVLRPRDVRRPPENGTPRRLGRFGAYRGTGPRETFGAYGRFGARLRELRSPAEGTPQAQSSATVPSAATPDAAGDQPHQADPRQADPHHPVPAPREAPGGLPWGIAVLAGGLTVETYASRTATGTAALTTPGVLVGWILTALGLALAAPGLTHLCGRLLQSLRPGALRLLAGRVLMEESSRIGHPLGVVCAVASAAYTTAIVYDTDVPLFGPLTGLGALVVVGCAVATLLTAAVEAKHARADTTAALLRLGAPATMLRSAAALRAGTLLALFGPLTLIVAELTALPMAR